MLFSSPTPSSSPSPYSTVSFPSHSSVAHLALLLFPLKAERVPKLESKCTKPSHGEGEGIQYGMGRGSLPDVYNPKVDTLVFYNFHNYVRVHVFHSLFLSLSLPLSFDMRKVTENPLVPAQDA